MAAVPSITSATTPMHKLDKSNLGRVLADIRLGRYAALQQCVCAPAIRGLLTELLMKFGVDQTKVILQAMCCQSCAAVAPPPLSGPGAH